ncbi:hypothetical protein CY34DRAFT_13535 [Suillus luteus UH-Slu-Lm8-n1]|uniref:Uncharacterized protein n=1 Tax=Suillus luteus UH-Slu-Lm8-n1 TaxID=930992 RepID=A0A0D0B2J2_9AGAM|nr:hypothetical protein CY34DRAFT_13535 [Suillus luteus UH-Slu-Lm8-n1]
MDGTLRLDMHHNPALLTSHRKKCHGHLSPARNHGAPSATESGWTQSSSQPPTEPQPSGLFYQHKSHPCNRNLSHPRLCNPTLLNTNPNPLNPSLSHLSATHWEPSTAQQILRTTIPCTPDPRGLPMGGLRDASVQN